MDRNYFLLSWKNTNHDIASAFAPEDADNQGDLIQKLDGLHEMPFDFKLFKLSPKDNEVVKSVNLDSISEVWNDYQANNLAWPLMSHKTKTIIENCLTGNENIDWITTKISKNDEAKVYYILRFKEMLDVLDFNKTTFVEGTDMIIRPCFSLSKICKYAIFHKPITPNLWKITSGLYVNEPIKKAIQKAKLKGIEFSKVRVE